MREFPKARGVNGQTSTRATLKMPIVAKSVADMLALGCAQGNNCRDGVCFDSAESACKKGISRRESVNSRSVWGIEA